MKQIYTHIANRLEYYFQIDARFFIRGGFWLTCIQGVSIIGGLLTSVIFANYLTPQDFGIYRYLIGLSALLAAISLTGLSHAILQTAAKKYFAFYRETLWFNGIYSSGITVSAIIGAFYYWWNDNDLLALGCLCIGLLEPLIVTFSNTAAYLQGSQRFTEAATLHTLKTITVTLGSLIALYFSDNILVLLISYLATSLLTNLIAHWYYIPTYATSTPTEVSTRYRSYAVHTSARNLIANVANRLDTIIVFTLLGAPELALYIIATIIPEQIKGSVKNLASLLLQKYTKNDNIDQLRKSVPKRSLQLLLILVVLTILYIAFSPILYNLLFPKYESAVLLSQILALAFPALILYVPYSILQSKVAEKALHKITVYSSLSQVLITIVLIHFFGLLGAIIAKVIHRYILLLLSLKNLYRI